MISHLHRIRKERLNGERGFTLTELLVVIVIIGILVAIAIPVFLSQRTAAYERAVQSDVRNGIPAVEAFYANHNVLPADASATAGDADTVLINQSPDVTIVYALVTATNPDTYTITGTHAQLGAKAWTYDSATSKTTVTP